MRRRWVVVAAAVLVVCGCTRAADRGIGSDPEPAPSATPSWTPGTVRGPPHYTGLAQVDAMGRYSRHDVVPPQLDDAPPPGGLIRAFDDASAPAQRGLRCCWPSLRPTG